MEKRSESFGRLLKAGMAAIAHIEGKTQQAVEGELGALIGVAGATLQRYKAGYIPPNLNNVERLAAACVQRGLLGRLWLERLLEAARFRSYSIRTVLAALTPETAPTAQPKGPRPNLPPPSYPRFIMRHDAYRAVVAGLASELPVTLIVSLAGMGKTSLARAVAGACAESTEKQLCFASVAWLSDKDYPGTTNLSMLLDTIARVLDYPGLPALPFDARVREVEDLLRRQPVLLVVDNAETITDDALIGWLARLPGPSKALVTSRVALPPYINAYTVQLGSLTAAEARSLIADWLPHSRLRDTPGVLEASASIVEAAGGNAKAIELALGLLQHHTYNEVLAELLIARSGHFDHLFSRAWNVLDAAEQRILCALPLFPTSAAAEALAYSADVSPAGLVRSAEHLVSLSLLDVERSDLRNPPRYNAHPLVRAYARARLLERSEVERHALHERWLTWCIDLATAVGFCWNDLDRLSMLDEEHATIQAAIHWATEQGRDQAVIALVEGVRYYYNVRGLWGDEELGNNARRAAAAHRLGDHDHEVLALSHHIQILCKQGRIVEAAPLVALVHERGEARYGQRLRNEGSRATSNTPPLQQLFNDAAFEYGHALAHYARARGELQEAERRWRELLLLSRQLGGQQYVINRRWLATVLLQQQQVVQARHLYVESLADARTIHDTRSVSGNMLKLAALDLADGELAAAASALAACREIAARYHDRRRLAECHRLLAALLQRQGNSEAAQTELHAALDLFERLSMQQEALEARQASQRCNATTGLVANQSA